MQNTRLLIGRRSSVGLSYILTTVVTGRAQLFASDDVAALVVREFQRLDQEGFTRSIAYVVMPTTSTGWSNCAPGHWKPS